MTTAADLHGSYLARAAVGVTLVAHPAVATTWDQPSALAEFTVQADDLSASVGIPTPTTPPQVTDTVLVLLARPAAHRHGPTAMPRALGRAECAPATIAAF